MFWYVIIHHIMKKQQLSLPLSLGESFRYTFGSSSLLSYFFLLLVPIVGDIFYVGADPASARSLYSGNTEIPSPSGKIFKLGIKSIVLTTLIGIVFNIISIPLDLINRILSAIFVYIMGLIYYRLAIITLGVTGSIRKSLNPAFVFKLASDLSLLPRVLIRGFLVQILTAFALVVVALPFYILALTAIATEDSTLPIILLVIGYGALRVMMVFFFLPLVVYMNASMVVPAAKQADFGAKPNQPYTPYAPAYSPSWPPTQQPAGAQPSNPTAWQSPQPPINPQAQNPVPWQPYQQYGDQQPIYPSTWQPSQPPGGAQPSYPPAWQMPQQYGGPQSEQQNNYPQPRQYPQQPGGFQPNLPSTPPTPPGQPPQQPGGQGYVPKPPFTGTPPISPLVPPSDELKS